MKTPTRRKELLLSSLSPGRGRRIGYLYGKHERMDYSADKAQTDMSACLAIML